jgi:hypothetical protein
VGAVADVFVSYKSEDRERVRLLVASLRRSGLSVWWDQDIPQGAPWEESIAQALNAAKCVIVCWTKLSAHHQTGKKVQVEAREAQDAGKLLQVLLEKVAPPLFFRQAQAADLATWNGDEGAAKFQVIAQATRDILDGREPASLEPIKRGRKVMFLVVSFLILLIVGGFAVTAMVWAPLNAAVAATVGRAHHTLVAGKGDPIIVGIYPTDAFGPLHRHGLHAALAPYARVLRIVDLEAPYSDMKADQADALLADLRRVLIEENVVAVVGPPVTEFTRSVIDEVKRTGLLTPIFLTSATSRDAAGWEESDRYVFRINSGVDERAHEFVGLARAAISSAVPLVFLVETSTNSDERTYGQILFDSITDKIPEWAQWVEDGLVTRRNFQRGDIVNEVARWNADEFLGRSQIVMLLGVGSDYTALMDGYYRTQHRPRVSLLGGWMNAYNTEPNYRANVYQWDRMFEVTDIRFNAVSGRDAAQRFISEFGTITPALRDQAFSFDSGTVVAKAFLDSRSEAERSEFHTTPEFLSDFARLLSRKGAQGVTGDIGFDELGQNAGDGENGLMTYAQFDGTGWRVLDGPLSVLAPLERSPSAPGSP